MISARISADTITPDLIQRIRAFKDRRPILEAMGAALVSVATLAFRQSALRPTPWKPIRAADGKFKAPLYDTGALKHSIRIITATRDSVTVGSDRPYAAAHQFGSKPYVITPKTAKALFWPGAGHPVKSVNHPGLPPRPFFPFSSSGQITPEAARRIESATRAKIAAASR
jgi:phage gpG-like protein